LVGVEIRGRHPFATSIDGEEVVDAVPSNCRMVERNAGVAEGRIVFRIGIHIGDAVEEADGDPI
jgi:class 3 adenylate cyclase